MMALVLCSAVSATAADVYKPEMLFPKGRIHDLRFEEDLSLVRIESSGLGLQSSISFTGFYVRRDWKLFIGDHEISLNPYGAFKVDVIVYPGKNSYLFKAVGPNGEVETQEVFLTGNAVGAVPETVEKRVDKNWFLFPGVSVSSIQTTQTGREDYSTLALTGKVSFNYRIVPRKWDLGANAFGTLLQFTKNTDKSARYFGANARLGYFFPPISSDLFISLYAGYYFSSTFVTDNYFGFKNVGGPQIYPAVRKVLANGNVLAWYFKFSPIASSLSLMTLSNNEIASGLSYSVILSGDHSLGIGIDYSSLTLSSDLATCKTKSLSLGVQYGL